MKSSSATTSPSPSDESHDKPLPRTDAVVRPAKWVQRIDKRVPGFSEDEQTILGSSVDSSGCG